MNQRLIEVSVENALHERYVSDYINIEWNWAETYPLFIKMTAIKDKKLTTLSLCWEYRELNDADAVGLVMRAIANAAKLHYADITVLEK